MESNEKNCASDAHFNNFKAIVTLLSGKKKTYKMKERKVLKSAINRAELPYLNCYLIGASTPGSIAQHMADTSAPQA